MPKQGCEIGVVGLGTMGRNLVLNLADHGFAVAVYNRTAEKTREFMAQEVGARDIRPGYDLKEFAGLLRQPRAMLILVAAGAPVDAVIRNSCRCWTPAICSSTAAIPISRTPTAGARSWPRKVYCSWAWASPAARTAPATARA